MSRRVDLAEKHSTLSTIRTLVRKKIAKVKRSVHSLRVLIVGMLWTRRPLLVHIIPMRRCNLACSYCNEYDNFSAPVPLDVMIRRIDKLADLGTGIITISGGEPLLHPDLCQMIAHMRKRGIFVGLITNGYLLNEHQIRRLNKAGLEHLQISIDNVKPDDVSMKSLKVLDQKLVLLARFAEFEVNVNSVIGSGIERPEDALVVARRASELGLATSVGIAHDGNGRLKPMDEQGLRIYRELKSIGTGSWWFTNGFEKNLIQGKPNDWRCRAGGRYLYVDEDGLVHYCSQQRGYPAKPLESYSHEDIRREYLTTKACAPYCTVGCVQRISVLDSWRDPQTLGARKGARTRLDQRPQK